MNNKKDIVFFTPTLYRTGSEIVLINLLDFAKEYYNVTLITKYKGELYDQLPSTINKQYLYRKQNGGIISKIVNRLKSHWIVPALLKKHKNSIWYINTIVLPDILEFSKNNNVKTIVHLHELEQMYTLLSTEQIQLLVSYPSLVIANSNKSAQALKKYGRTENMRVVYPAIDTDKINSNQYSAYRKKLNISDDTFLWAMCGTLDKNKNPFLFIEIACELKKNDCRFKMVWIGGTLIGPTIQEECKLYAKEKNVEDVIIWLGDVKTEFHNYFSTADGFVLTSDFESFSIATVEALLLGLPVVANDCGGVSEILEDKWGYVAKEKNNAKEMAEKMKEIMLLGRSENKQELIKRGKQFDSKVIGKNWIEILNEYLQ